MIMKDGTIECSGSSLFLKQKLCTNFRITFIRDENNIKNESITNFIESYTPNAKLLSNVGNEMKYLMPKKDKYLLSSLFGELEKQKHILGINSFEVCDATMDDVFNK